MLTRKSAVATVLAGLAAASGEAYAQRAGENAVTAAEDAFGTTVGNESVGLYDAGDARGFSPAQAGNVRIEGLYFDQQAELGGRIISGSTVHVGISAQSYAFPAPTGVADFHLRLPGEETIVSVSAGYGPYASSYVEVDAQVPVIKNKLSIGFGAGIADDVNAWGGRSPYISEGVLVRWTPTGNIEVVPFWSNSDLYNWEAQPFVFTGGSYLPPRIKRRQFYGQSWADVYEGETNFGALGRAAFGKNWLLRAGIFRSIYSRPDAYIDLFRNTQPNGVADRTVVAYPPNRYASTSGEVRLAHIFNEGPRRHTASIALRGRDVSRVFGGTQPISLGAAVIGVHNPLPEPTPTLNPRSNSHAKQGTVGFSYEGLWANVGEISLGLQKTFYNISVNQPNLPTASSRARPWLFNGTVTGYVNDALALYAGYTRGLEESGTAPSVAANRGEALPASITKQVDAGLRYAITPNLKMVAGVFQVTKPYFNLDSTNIFRNLGTVRHRGVELSLSGQVIEGLTVVAGTVILQARVSGPDVDAGLVGRVPLGPLPRISKLNVVYGPESWRGFSVDAELENESRRVADDANTFKVPSNTTFDLGARYNFKLLDVPATLRVQAKNITNVFTWEVSSAGYFTYNDPRRYSVNLTADF